MKRLLRASKSFSERTTRKTQKQKRIKRMKKRVKVRKTQISLKKKSPKRKRKANPTRGTNCNKCSLRKTTVLDLKDG